MSDYLIMKAVEFDKLPVKFKKLHGSIEALAEAGWWTQKKYDGCMGIAMMSRGGSRMLSRTGEDYSESCAHILDELHSAADDFDPGWEDFIVIGEAWVPIEEAAFPAISGRFRRKKHDSHLRFIANDLLPPGFNTTEAYRLRFADLCELLPAMGTARVTVAETFHTERDPYGKALAWQGAGGFDGAVLRDPDAGYTVGTVKAGEIVKVKPTLSLDLRCTSRVSKPGEKTGRDVWTISVIYRGVFTVVGSGVPHAESEVPELGDIVEIECLGITEDGKLREPRFKGVRFDKVKPD